MKAMKKTIQATTSDGAITASNCMEGSDIMLRFDFDSPPPGTIKEDDDKAIFLIFDKCDIPTLIAILREFEE